MLTRGIGVTLIIFAIVLIAVAGANLYFFTNLKATRAGQNNETAVNVYLSFNSVLLILSVVILALGVLLVIPESHWKRKMPELPLDL